MGFWAYDMGAEWKPALGAAHPVPVGRAAYKLRAEGLGYFFHTDKHLNHHLPEFVVIYDWTI